MWDFEAVILGEPASAKNQRRIVKVKGIPRLIKSSKALKYSDSFRKQCPQLDPLLDGDLALWIDAYYSSRRPDLACSEIIKDLLQGFVYANDRQVKAELSLWNLDKENPRVHIRCRRISSVDSTGMSSLEPSMIWGSALR